MPKIIKIFTPVFPGGKGKALTFSYDDGVRQDNRLVELLNKYGFKGTFNLGAGLFEVAGSFPAGDRKVDITRIRADDVNALYDGHEVAGHGYMHSGLNSADTGMAMYEIITDRYELERITGKMIRGFAYPFGQFDDNVKTLLRMAGFAYARTIKSTREFRLPDDWLEWNPTCHHNDPELMRLAEKFCTEKPFFFQPQVFYLWGHAYEFDQQDNWNLIEGFLAYMARYKDDIWAATNIEIANYLNAFKRLAYSADGNMVHNPTNIDILFAVRFDRYTVHPGETVALKQGAPIL
jgi:hypothetical protein